MKKLMAAGILLSLCFATGFTCSKNTPPPAAEQPAATSTETATDQSQMAAPPAGTEAAPATQPAPTTPDAAAPAAPAETK